MPITDQTPDGQRTRKGGRSAGWDAFEAVVHERRAVREFSRAPVPEHDVHDLLDAAILAPSSSNLQPFELCWVRTSEAKRKLVRACMSQPAARTAAELIVCVARWDRCDETRKELARWLRDQPRIPRAATFYYDHLAQLAYDQGPLGLYGRARRLLLRPLLLALPLPRGPWTREDVRVWAVKSTALACENLMLAARAKGLDTCPMEGVDPIRVGRIVGLDASQWRRTWDLTMVIAVGHRSPDARVGARWRRERARLVREL